MNQLRLSYPVQVLAQTLEIPGSTFYARRSRPVSLRAQSDAVLKPRILAVHKLSRATYGSMSIQGELADQGIRVGRDRIHRLRKEMGLKCIQNKKFKATTNSAHDLPVAPNLLGQEFRIEAPGKVWGSDITYIPTGQGWLYLAGVKDFGSREIVGYAMGASVVSQKSSG